MPVATKTLLVANGLSQRLAQRDADILDGVMRVDVQIALRLDVKVNQAMPRHLVEHVVEKGNAGRQAGLSGPIEIQANLHLGFQGVSADFGLPHAGPIEKHCTCGFPARPDVRVS